MRWFLRLLLFAAVYNTSGNATVFTDKRVINSSTSPVETLTGQRIDRHITTIPLKIPDNFPLGITSSIWLDDFALLNAVKVEVHIAHPHVGDLLVQLECPNGLIVTLHNRDGGGKKNHDRRACRL